MSQISIERPWAYFGCARALKIIIDGEDVGKVNSRKSEIFTVSPGSHMVQVSMDWCKSKAYPIELAENSLVKLRVKTQFALFAIIFCFVRPSNVFEIVIRPEG